MVSRPRAYGTALGSARKGDNLDLTVFREALRAHGYARVGAAADAEAIGLAEARSPSLMAMDMRFPGASGMDVTGTLEATVDPLPMPAVAMTAFTGHGDEGRVHAGGGEDNHAEPASIRHMIETIRRQLD